MEWVRSVMDALDPFATGRYVGEVDISRGTARIRECFSPESWQRLKSLNQKYNPAGLFTSFLTGA